LNCLSFHDMMLRQKLFQLGDDACHKWCWNEVVVALKLYLKFILSQIYSFLSYPRWQISSSFIFSDALLSKG
jgi:hypothetical protein